MQETMRRPPELIQVAPVEAAGGIDGQMGLEAEQAQEQGLVERQAKLLQAREIVGQCGACL